MHDMCGMHYLGALLLSQLAGLPMSAIGTKRTSPSAPHMSAYDPKRTSDERGIVNGCR